MPQQPSVVHEEPSTSTSEARLLEAVLNEIRVDSRQSPQAYLAETEVQHGGE
jgi:hypothetical protein